MLRELRIENLLLIERAELRLGEGLNAITGETGAGKTVLAHSLDLLMGGKAKAQIVRPGAEEAWVEGVFDLPEGLLEEPELAELAERLPEGADEVVLGRRVSAGGRTSAFVAGRAATAADLKLLGGRLLAFFGQHEHRRLTIASAQLEILDGFAGAEHLELRRALPRGAPRVRAARRRAGRAARARRVAGARPRPLPLRALRDRGGGAGARGAGGDGGRARAPAPRRGPARGGGRAPTPAWPAPRRTAAARRRRWPRPNRCCRARPASTRPRRDRRAGRGAGGRARRRRLPSCATTPRGSRPTRRRCWRSRSGWRRSTGSSASTAAASSRCSRTPSAAGPRSPAWRAPRCAAPRPRRRWPRPRARRAELGEQLSAGRAEAAAPLEERVAAELEQLSMAGATLEVVLEPHPDGFGATGARRSSCGSLPTPGSRRRRCATRPPAASSRG